LFFCQLAAAVLKACLWSRFLSAALRRASSDCMNLWYGDSFFSPVEAAFSFLPAAGLDAAFGAMVRRMTGAGGGGSVFAFLKPDTSQTVMEMIRDELTKLDYELWQPPLGGPGLLLHTRKPDLFSTPFKSK